MSPRALTSGRRGYSLLELVVTLPVATLLVVGLASAIHLASRTIPQPGSAAGATMAAADGLERLGADLRCATAIVSRSASELVFTVPDRTGDAAPDTIRYVWTGVAGTPLIRQVNGGASEELASGVQELQLTYGTRQETTPASTIVNVSPTILLASFDGWSGVSPTVKTYSVTTSSWIGEYFLIDAVTLPPTTSKVQISRVDLVLKKSSSTSPTTVAIHRPRTSGDPEPASAPVGTPATVTNAMLQSSWAWTSITMPTDVLVTQRQTEFVIVVKGGSSSPTAAVQYYYSTNAPNDAAPTLKWSNVGGLWWSPTASNERQNDARFRIYGCYETTDTVPGTTTYFLRSVNVHLRAQLNSTVRLDTSVRLLNEPQVSGP